LPKPLENSVHSPIGPVSAGIEQHNRAPSETDALHGGAYRFVSSNSPPSSGPQREPASITSTGSRDRLHRRAARTRSVGFCGRLPRRLLRHRSSIGFRHVGVRRASYSSYLSRDSAHAQCAGVPVAVAAGGCIQPAAARLATTGCLGQTTARVCKSAVSWVCG
jgi:hypothetical protein